MVLAAGDGVYLIPPDTRQNVGPYPTAIRTEKVRAFRIITHVEDEKGLEVDFTVGLTFD